MSQGLEIVIFSPARRASRKLLERITEFVRLLGFDDRIMEFNQEQLRLKSLSGKNSLIRSFPSKVKFLPSNKRHVLQTHVCPARVSTGFGAFRPFEYSNTRTRTRMQGNTHYTHTLRLSALHPTTHWNLPRRHRC